MSTGGEGTATGGEGTAATVRPATAADAAAIAEIHQTSRAATMPYLPPQRRTREQVTRWAAEVLLDECLTWVAERDGRVLGYAALAGDRLEHLYLRPELRRQGIGTLLLDAVKRHSPGSVSLHVFEQNTEARAFYARHGFAEVDRGDGERNMEGLPDLTLSWSPRA